MIDTTNMTIVERVLIGVGAGYTGRLIALAMMWAYDRIKRWRRP